MASSGPIPAAPQVQPAHCIPDTENVLTDYWPFYDKRPQTRQTLKKEVDDFLDKIRCTTSLKTGSFDDLVRESAEEDFLAADLYGKKAVGGSSELVTVKSELQKVSNWLDSQDHVDTVVATRLYQKFREISLAMGQNGSALAALMSEPDVDALNTGRSAVYKSLCALLNDPTFLNKLGRNLLWPAKTPSSTDE